MIEDLKVYLRADDEENSDIEKLLSDGKRYLNNLAGIELDFNNYILAKTLLLDYCRYKYNNASEYFLENFREDILRMQLESAVIDNANKTTDNE